MMKRILFAFTIIAALSLIATAQKTATTFPGVSAAQKRDLQAIKRTLPFPLPTWLPAGFKLESINSDIKARTLIYDRSLVFVYSNKMADGGIQRFAFEAGFDGLGDLMYEPTKTLRTGVGEVILIYEPKDDEGNIEKGYVMTEWFNVGQTAFHYIGSYGFDEGDKSERPISLDDTVKILKSLKRF